MSSHIILNNGSLTQDFLDNLKGYYDSINVAENYAEHKWQLWKTDKRLKIYAAEKDSRTIGWIVYNPDSSTIEEILIKKDWKEKGMEALMVDALLIKESLVAIRILKQEMEKYARMVEYGFRPTHSFTSDGFDFHKMDLSTTIFFDKVKGQKPSKEYTEKESVAVIKVPPTRAYDEIKAALMNLLNSLGGLNKFVKKGQTVAIKPNVVSDHGHREGVYTGGIVTDVRLVQALIEILLTRAGKVVVAEGASINRVETMKLFELYGYDKLIDIDPERVSLVDINVDDPIEKPVPGGKRMLSREIPVTLENADVIINMPVMKTHFAALASLSIKNLQGAIPPLEKYMSHFFGLWQNLVNIHYIVKPRLIIMDGLIAQENFGPVYGTPKEMNLLIGGTNAVAVDSVTMRIMGLDPAKSPPVHLAYMQGLGPVEPEKIEIKGSSINEVMSPFEKPVLDLSGGKDFLVHDDNACQGCRGYLHYVLYKLRRPDPKDPESLLIDRAFEKKVNLFLGPVTRTEPDHDETNVFMGICQQHNSGMGKHLPGCPPHAEVIMKGIFNLFPDVERPQYADKSAEDKLEEMLEEVLANDSGEK